MINKFLILLLSLSFLSGCSSKFDSLIDSVGYIEIYDYRVDKNHPTIHIINKENSSVIINYLSSLKFKNVGSWCEGLVEQEYVLVMYSKSGTEIAKFMEKCPGLVFYDSDGNTLIAKSNRMDSPYDFKYREIIDLLLEED